MSVQTSYPGVYVQEVPSGVRTIAGVSTSIALFVGVSKKGPINKPQRFSNYTSFKNKYGDDSTAGQLAQYIKLFFLNGGTDCWVMRIANAPTPSAVVLKGETGATVLKLEAADAGRDGDFIRASVNYRTIQPESTFNIELFRWEKDSAGNDVKTGSELWTDLTFNPSSPRYVQTFLNQNSKLVKATDIAAAPLALGSSISGRPVRDAAGGSPFRDAWNTLLGSAVTTNTFQINVGDKPPVNVNLSGFVVTNTQNDLKNAVATAIQAAYNAAGYPGVTVTVSFVGAPTARRLKIEGTAADRDVRIRQGLPEAGMVDLASSLMMGTEQGGLEISGYADRRPAPNGITYRAAAADAANIIPFDSLLQNGFTQVSLESILSNLPVTQNIATLTAVQTTGAGDLFTKDNYPVLINGHNDGIREKFQVIANLINNFIPPVNHSWPWRAEVWGYRLAILPKENTDDNFSSAAVAFITASTLPATSLTKNVHYYSLGPLGMGGFQVPGSTGSDGTAPDSNDYDNAYSIIDKEVDLFNLLILPPVTTAAIPVGQLYGNASVFCNKRRSFLLMDPPDTWADAQTASTGVAATRIGLVKDYSAMFFPKITINDNGLSKNIGASGALAGLFARTDSTRGVWKAPAGIEADLRGISGVEQQFSDSENGILNPRAINTVRVFPSGIVNWGARTNFGDDDTPHDYKYIPVRRTALYIEESLYRGLKWVVFEPNDEPLWAQIRLNVGAFMHNLFRQGAFQGIKKTDAYFVKCDSETTTQNDINLGIVNVWVGFAPLKPAEFVVLYLQQMAGNILI